MCQRRITTGSEALDALRCRTRGAAPGSTIKLARLDAYDLYKLRISDLESAGYPHAAAEEISADLMRHSLAALGKHLRLNLEIGDDAPPLIPESAG